MTSDNRTEKICIDPNVKLKHWGYGEWVEEPDEVIFYYKDIKCEILRVMVWDGWNKDHLSLGHLCGYVTLPDNHPWFGKSMDSDSLCGVEVHGGITYSRQEGIHWKIGFDCAHSVDLVPSVEVFKKQYKDPFMEDIKKNFPKFSFLIARYRNIAYVEEECKGLADNVLAVNNSAPNQCE